MCGYIMAISILLISFYFKGEFIQGMVKYVPLFYLSSYLFIYFRFYASSSHFSFAGSYNSKYSNSLNLQNAHLLSLLLPEFYSLAVHKHLTL